MRIETLCEGACHVWLAGDGREPSLVPAVADLVAIEWDAERVRRPGLHNGVLMSAVQATPGNLVVRQAEYRCFLAQRRRPDLRSVLQVRPVAVSGLVRTADGRWLFGRRGAEVTQYPQHVEAVPSGALDERALAGRAPRPGLELDPVPCLLAELAEEAGVAATAIRSLKPLVVLLDVEEDTFDLVYLVDLHLSATEIRQQFAEALAPAEYGRIDVLSSEEADLEMANEAVVPTTRAIWATMREQQSQKGGRP
jgi:hypothetical protein